MQATEPAAIVVSFAILSFLLLSIPVSGLPMCLCLWWLFRLSSSIGVNTTLDLLSVLNFKWVGALSPTGEGRVVVENVFQTIISVGAYAVI